MNYRMTGTFSAFTAIYFEGIVSLIHLSQRFMIYHGLSTDWPALLHKYPVCGKEVHAAERLKLCKHEKVTTDLVRGCSFLNSW